VPSAIDWIISRVARGVNHAYENRWKCRRFLVPNKTTRHGAPFEARARLPGRGSGWLWENAARSVGQLVWLTGLGSSVCSLHAGGPLPVSASVRGSGLVRAREASIALACLRSDGAR
jgi:hypothetical protein